MGDYDVQFAPNQTLPPGYVVRWHEHSELYCWVKGDYELTGVDHWNRFRARRDAWAHYKAQQTEEAQPDG